MTTIGKNGESSPAATAPTIRIFTDPVTKGEASAELNAIHDEIYDYITKYPDVFSGASFSADSSQLIVGVSQPELPAAQGYEEMANRLDPGRVRVLTKDAKWSWSALDEVKDNIVSEYLMQAKGGIQSVGVNVTLDTVVVTARTKDSPLESNPALLEIAERYPDSVMFKESIGEIKVASSFDDVDPHFGGAGYWWYDALGNRQERCSLGFPIILNNVTYGLTAGHCRPATASNYVNAYSTAGTDGRHYFGSLFTTTWKGTQNIYGDFSLLRYSSYSPYVYSASNTTTNSFLPVVAAAFTFPTATQNMCSSGNTTAQVCRYKVIESNMCAEYEVGTNVCELFRMTSDQNLDGVTDCIGFAQGDSGGAVYNAVPGGVKAYGIVGGFSDCVDGFKRNYYSTSLHGVRDWQPLASMPLIP